MSFQRPISTHGPSTASYSEFLKDIYSSLRSLSTGLATINTRLDTLTQHLQSVDARLAQQDFHTQNLSERIDTLIQRTENTQIRQTTASTSLLSELDALGARQVEPSTGLAELGARTDKSISSTGLFSKLSFQLPPISELSEITTLERSPTNTISTDQQFDEPSTTTTGITTTNSEINTESMDSNQQQLGTNFLILD
jgi:hypothetical protein